MPRAVKITSPPQGLAVSLEAAKLHCRVDGTDEDTLLAEQLIPAAVEWVERRIGRALITQTIRVTFDGFPACIRLPRAPVQADTSADVTITYLDTNGDSQTLEAADYRVIADAEPALVEPAYGTIWPVTQSVTGAVTLTYTAGYGDDYSCVPAGIRQAILLLVGHWYVNREDVVTGTITAKIQSSVDALLSAYWTGEYT